MIVVALGWSAEGRNARRKTQLYHAHPEEFDEAVAVRGNCAIIIASFLRGEVRMRGSILFLACLLIVFPCQAGTLTVDDNGPADFHNIQAAINTANDGDIVIVSPGTYAGPGNHDIDFLGKAITVRSTDPNDPNIVAATIIDCNGTQADPHRGFYFYNNEDANSILAGLTITNGYSGHGGGISCEESSPKIINCTLRRNTAKTGGGIYCYINCCPSITNCTFSGNVAYSEGGGMFNLSSPILSGCTFSENSAGSGGGMANRLSGASLANCTFHRNWAGKNGGGIANNYSHTTLTNCILTANGAHEYGGGIASGGAYAELLNCSFSKNWATRGNAVGCDSYKQKYPSSLQVTNCILWGGPNQIWNNDGSTINMSYSDVGGYWPGEGNIDADPCFAFNTDCHLMPDSLCIDAGTNTASGLPTTDIEGKPRILDGDGNGSAVADMGAYEYYPGSPSIAVSASSFSYVRGYTRSVQTLLIRNCGADTLNWQIAEDCDWLEASPASGVSTGDINQVSMSVDWNTLTEGYYDCALHILDQNAINSPVMIYVSLYIPRTLHVPVDYETIQAAIDAADDFDTVIVAPGRYTGDGNRDLDFLGKAVTVRSTDPNDPNVVSATIIDCNGTEEEPHRGFYFHSSEDANSVVDGLTITNGYAPNVETDWRPLWPMPIPVPPPGPWVADLDEDTSFSQGRSYYESYGGGIYCQSRSLLEGGPGPTIRNCIITNNSTAVGSDYAAGAGIYGSSGPIINCTVSGNKLSALGGCHGPIINCTITANKGGIFVCSGPIVNCIISGNNGFGVVYCAGTVTNCLITGNKGCGLGQCNGPILNCTIAHNVRTLRGGGIFFVCIGCPTGVQSSGGYSGDEDYPFVKGPLKIRNCIVWGNEAPRGPQMYLWGGSTFVSYSNIEGGQADIYIEPDTGYSVDTTLNWGEGNINSDPHFVQPGHWADANDPNILVEPNDPNAVWIDGDYHLLSDSPCIDAGDPNYIAELDATDLDGNPRIADGNKDGNSVVDMGAYEFFWPPMEVPMRFTPQALNPGSKGNWVKAHFVLPEGFAVEDVDTDSPAKIIEPFEPDIESDHINVFVNDDGLVEIEAAFPRAGFCGVGIDGNNVEVTVLGTLTSGQQFYGTDTIKIIDHHFECLADFASYWLQTDCGKPDWCGGADLNEDSAVNFLDFALFDACCIEIITE